MKEHLAGKRFLNYVDLKNGVGAIWNEEDSHKLVQRYKCLNVKGDYVEK